MGYRRYVKPKAQTHEQNNQGKSRERESEECEKSKTGREKNMDVQEPISELKRRETKNIRSFLRRRR